MRPLYRRPEPAYYWASPDVEAEPILGKPYYYYSGGLPKDWGYGKYEGGPYWYRERPAEDGFHYYGPKYRDQGPGFYERDGRDYGGHVGGDFRPVYVYPPPASATASRPYSFRPFHPGNQFRHPDEYPMRFVPMTYGSSGPWEIEHTKPHCCGCPNHVCHPETRSVKGVERKGLMDGVSEEDLKAKPQNMKEMVEPIMWFNPAEWWNGTTEIKDRNEEKGKEHPMYRSPVNWNRNDGYKEQKGQFPGYWIPFNPNYRPQGEGEEKNNFPGYWIPLERPPRGQGQDGKNSPLEGKEEWNRFPGYWIPLDSTRLQGQEEDRKNYLFEEKPQPFPVLWIPEGNWKAANPREGTNKEIFEKEDKKNNEADNRPVIVQEVGKEDDRQRPVQEVGKEGEKQGPVEGIKETKVRDIPVKQLDEGKSAQAQKREEKVANNHKVSSPRAPKLPPVCLRADPLPGKKKSNGKSYSRSPSPPRKEQNTKDNDTSKRAEIPTLNASVEKNIMPDASKVSVEVNKAEGNGNLITSKVAGEVKKAADENASLKASKLSSEIENAEDLKASKVNGGAKKVEDDLRSEEARVRKPELSRNEAALKIQAFYRGCRVRKLQPLSKLREIAKIKTLVEELKLQIRSSDFVEALGRDNKTKGRMNETLMALLLQLDTIQGLHPVVRDVRKSVARELVQLQEKLDSMVEAHIGISQPCARDMTENNMIAAQDMGKCLEATEDSGKALLDTSTETQQVENEIRKDGENAQEKEIFKQESLQIGNEENNDCRDYIFVKKEANDSTEETRNATTDFGENVEDTAPVQQEALEVSYDLKLPSLPMHLQKAETEKQEENVENEKELASMVTSEDIVSTVNSVEIPLRNVALENEEKSDSVLENISVENEKKLEPNNLEEPDSSLPRELDTAAENEISTTSTLEQEQEVAACDNLNALDENANATLEQGGEVVVIEPEAEPENQISSGYDEVSGFEENRTASEGALNALKGKILGDDKLEFNTGAASDSPSGSPSEGIDETNKVEEALPAAENLSEKEELAAAMAQGTDDSIVEKSILAPTTGEEPSTMASKYDPSIHKDEENETKCSGPSDTESGAFNIVDKLGMESSHNKSDLAHSEKSSESKALFAKYVRNQDHEKWEDENEKLREMVEKLVEAEKNQMSTIAQLNDKIMLLEEKLGKGKGMRKGRAGQLRLRSNRVARNTECYSSGVLSVKFCLV